MLHNMCHPSANLSVDKYLKFFYYPHIKKMFDWEKACIKCGSTKHPKANGEAPSKQLTFHKFNDCIVVDHPVPRVIPRGWRYILTIAAGHGNLPAETCPKKYGLSYEIIVHNYPTFPSEFLELMTFKRANGRVTKGPPTVNPSSLLSFSFSPRLVFHSRWRLL